MTTVFSTMGDRGIFSPSRDDLDTTQHQDRDTPRLPFYLVLVIQLHISLAKEFGLASI